MKPGSPEYEESFRRDAEYQAAARMRDIPQARRDEVLARQRAASASHAEPRAIRQRLRDALLARRAPRS